jgi:phage I-like protein
MMNYPICNRDESGAFQLPPDHWYHLAPKGEFPHPDSGLVQIIDDTALAAMASRFDEESKRPNFPGLLVDFDHFSYDPEKSSTAAGWITALEPRDDGLWGQIRWSDEGQSALEKGRFRLISPTWLARDVEPLGNQRIRPLRLDTAGLTNHPNLRGMAPLSNRHAPDGPTEITPKHEDERELITEDKDQAQNLAHPSSILETKPTKGNMKQVCTTLGLSADASEEAALTELAKIKNRVQELETQNQSLLTAQVEADLAQYANRFKAEAREDWKAQLLANRAGTIKLLESLPEPKAESRGSLHNRAAAKTPPSNGWIAPEGKAAEQRQAVTEYKNRHSCTWQHAWNAMRAERPELFPNAE